MRFANHDIVEVRIVDLKASTTSVRIAEKDGQFEVAATPGADRSSRDQDETALTISTTFTGERNFWT